MGATGAMGALPGGQGDGLRLPGFVPLKDADKSMLRGCASQTICTHHQSYPQRLRSGTASVNEFVFNKRGAFDSAKNHKRQRRKR